MPQKSLVPEAVDRYVNELMVRLTPSQAALRAETQKLPAARMQTAPDQGALLSILVASIGARRVVEVGTFTGASALWMAAALPPGGLLVACDVSDEWTSIGRRHWQTAGVSERIDLRLGPALATLDGLLSKEGENSFDLAFIDADKGGYDAYYERCLRLVRPNGLLLLDNMLWSGEVVGPRSSDADTAALQALNLKVRDDARVEACLLTVGDGLLLARKK